MPISVLVVEDQPDLQEALRALLEREGYEVHCAVDPDEALALLGRVVRPCILLWDAMMPRNSLTMVSQATLEGVHVAILPVSVVSVHTLGATRHMKKQLTSESAILSIVREHCPLPTRAIA